MSPRRSLPIPALTVGTVAWLSILIVLTLCTLTLIGWLLDVALFKSAGSAWTWMKVVTAGCLAATAVALACILEPLRAGWKTATSRVLAIAVSVIGLSIVGVQLAALALGRELSPVSRPFLSVLLAPEERMAALTAIIFAFIGLVLVLLGTGSRRAADVAHALLVPVTLASYLIPLEHILAVQGVDRWLNVSLALHTEVAFFVLCIGLYCSRPDTWLMRVFVSDQAGGRMARRLLPALVILPVVIGWLSLYGQRGGTFGSEFGVALFAAASTLCLLWLVWVSARSVNLTDDRRRRSEEVQLEIERRYRNLVERSGMALIVSRGGRVEYVNPACLQLFGASRAGQLLGRSPFDLLDPDCHLIVQQRMEEVRQGRAVPPVEAKILRLGGEPRDVEAAVTAFVDSAGPAVQVVLTDVTERKRMADELEQRVQERTEQLKAASVYARSLIEASLDPLVTISPDGKITDVNRATEEATGVARDHLLGSDFSDYFTEPEMARRGYRQVLKDGFVRDYPLTIRHASGRTIEVLYNATVYGNAAGEAKGVFAAARDVTEHKKIEKELEDHRRNLEELVRQRTSELERAAAELARSNTDLEQFAYVSSHDLQEPLRMVTGFMQLLERRYQGRLDETADKYIHFAVDGAKRMQALINGLLAYSRLDSRGRKPEPTDCGQALKSAASNLALSIAESHADITSGDLPTVQADEAQVVQLFQNLIGNAIKFRSDQPPRIHVDGRRDGDFWVFSVRDNGIGIDPEFHEKIFMIFQRLHTRDKYPGTGMGLAVCRRIVERHGGRIWVESVPTQGTTFYFTLPA